MSGNYYTLDRSLQLAVAVVVGWRSCCCCFLWLIKCYHDCRFPRGGYLRRLYRRYIGPWTTLLWTGYSLVISTIQHGKSFQICTWPREQSEFVSVFSRSSRVGVIYCIENWRWAFAALHSTYNAMVILSEPDALMGWRFACPGVQPASNGWGQGQGSCVLFRVDNGAWGL